MDYRPQSKSHGTQSFTEFMSQQAASTKPAKGSFSEFMAQQSAPKPGSLADQLLTAGKAMAAKTLENANPINVVSNVGSLASHPIDTLTAGMSDYRQQAAKDFQRGNYLDAVSHEVAGLIPVLGPAFGRTVDALNSGDAETMGNAAGDLTSLKTVPEIYGGVAKVGGKAVTTAAPVLAKAAQPIVDSTAYKTIQDIAPMIPGGYKLYGAMKGASALTKILGKLFPDVTEESTPATSKPVDTHIPGKVEISPITITANAGKGYRVADTLTPETHQAMTTAAKDGTLHSLNPSERSDLVKAYQAGDNAGVQQILGGHSAVDALLTSITHKVNTMADYARTHGIDLSKLTTPEARVEFSKQAYQHGVKQGLPVPKSGYTRGVSDSTWNLLVDKLAGN